MQIVIELSEEDFEKNKNARCDYHTLRMAIKNGTPLPKGHGRLIDADSISFSQFFDAGDYAQARRGIHDAPTIIEADRK